MTFLLPPPPCPAAPHPNPPSLLHLCMTGCFVLLSSCRGSENRRNKLQGMMSDFPPKPTPSPSISGQARPGEGKTWQTSQSPFGLQMKSCLSLLPCM